MLEAWQRAGNWRPPAKELAQAAEVTPHDVYVARVAWLIFAPPKYRDLLEAAPEPD